MDIKETINVYIGPCISSAGLIVVLSAHPPNWFEQSVFSQPLKMKTWNAWQASFIDCLPVPDDSTKSAFWGGLCSLSLYVRGSSVITNCNDLTRNQLFFKLEWKTTIFEWCPRERQLNQKSFCLTSCEVMTKLNVDKCTIIAWTCINNFLTMT